jgi:hypothetical protein
VSAITEDVAERRKGVIKWMTAESLAADAANRWRKQYRRYMSDQNYRLRSGQHPMEILNALEALGDAPTPEAVSNIIGGPHWTTPCACNVCGENPDAVCEIGETPDYESSTAYVCLPCLQKAVRERTP